MTDEDTKRYLKNNSDSNLYKIGNVALQKAIVGSGIIDFERTIDRLFGSTHITGLEKNYEIKPSFWTSSYFKTSALLEVDEDGIFKGKFHNGVFNSLAIDLKILTLDVDVTNQHLNAGVGIAIPFTKNKFGVNADLGFNDKTLHPEIDASIYHADDKNSRDYGLKVSTDIINGLVGGYIRNTSGVPIDKNTVQKAIDETGFQILNIPSVAAVAIGVVAYKAVIAGSALKLAFTGRSALWLAIVNFF